MIDSRGAQSQHARQEKYAFLQRFQVFPGLCGYQQRNSHQQHWGGNGFGIWGRFTPCEIRIENTAAFFFFKVFGHFCCKVESDETLSSAVRGGGRASLLRRSRRIRSDRQLAAKSNDPFQKEDIKQMGSGARETWRGFESCLEDAGAGKLRSWEVVLFPWSCESLKCHSRRGRGHTQACVMHPMFAFGCCLIIFLINSGHV